MAVRAWVIGGTSGIGAAVAAYLANRNCTVNTTDEENADVASTVQLQDAFASFKPNWIVYCAGLNWPMPADKIDMFNAEEMLDVNVMGFIRVISIAASAELQFKPSSIVAIGSDSATRPMRNSIVYCASKAAIHAAVRCAARELAPYIRVNAVAPGTVDNTPMTGYVDKRITEIKGWHEGEALAADVSANPTGRRARADEIAQVVYTTLNGPQFLTGAIIEVNGGR